MDDFGFDTRLKPRRSVSSLSETTVASSVVNQMIAESSLTNNNHFAVENFVRDSNIAPRNFNFEGSSGVRVGNKIIHIYHPPPNEVNIKSNSPGTSPRRSISNNDSEQEILKTKSRCKNFKLSKLHMIIIVLIVILISTTTSLSIFLVNKKDPQETTTSFDSTTTDQTTTETSSTTTTTFVPISDVIVSRNEWTSNPIHPDIPPFSGFSYPIRRIIVGQTNDAETCMNKTECIAKVQEIRSRNSTLLDIPWNFLVGGDGKVYEGRGYRYEGEHTMNVDASDYNDIGIGMGFIGNFESEEPSTLMLHAFRSFIIESIENGDLMTDYKIFFQDQLTYKTNEAVKLGNSLKEIGNFYELQRIMKREEWGAGSATPGIRIIDNPLDRVIIHHSGTDWTCHNEQNCTAWNRVLQNNAFRIFELSDINYNFIIGGTGDYAVVMEGRGFNLRGAHTGCTGCNDVSLGIGLIGNFDLYQPGTALMNTMRRFIDDSAALGKLRNNFPVHLKRDYDGSRSPGDYVVNIVKNWTDYVRYYP